MPQPAAWKSGFTVVLYFLAVLELGNQVCCSLLCVHALDRDFQERCGKACLEQVEPDGREQAVQERLLADREAGVDHGPDGPNLLVALDACTIVLSHSCHTNPISLKESK